MPYASAYHDKNNTNLLSTYCKLLRKICPWLSYYSPNLAEKVLKEKYKAKNANSNAQPMESHQKKQICFISDSFTTDSSVVRDRIAIIGKLDRTKYDVYFASFNPYESICKKSIIAKLFMEKIKANYIYLGTNLSSARTILDPYKFDFIVYPDIGMKMMTTLLAYSRIAPIQITTWGHSETSGIDTIDYFISSEIFELNIEQSQTHYTEKLILLKSLGTYYISPHKLFIENNEEYCVNTLPNKLPNTKPNQSSNQSFNQSSNQSQNQLSTPKKTLKTREQFGFNKNQNLYVCLQTFYKINPEFEKCLARLLELDPNAIIILSNTYPFCKSHLTRIKNTVGIEKLVRICWFGSLEKDEFLNLVSICDVCLDPFPFGGFNTSYDAFDYNIPVITLETEYLHGRFTSGLYRKMELYDCECIVKTTEEYSQIASKIGINSKLKHKINRNIEMKKNLIFQEQQSVDEWNELFIKLVI